MCGICGVLDLKGASVDLGLLEQMIARLRKKIEPDPHPPEFLRTAHRDGYCLSVEERS